MGRTGGRSIRRAMYEDDPEIEHIAHLVLHRADETAGVDKVGKIINVMNSLNLSIMEKLRKSREEQRRAGDGKTEE